MSSARVLFTVRRLAAVNVAVAGLLAWVIWISDGNYLEWDERKTLLSIAMAFGLPAMLILAMGRGKEAAAGLTRAIRAGFGLHCGIMAAFCALPSLFWFDYLYVRAGPWNWLGARDRDYVVWSAGASLVVASLYGLGSILAIRSALRGGGRRPVEVRSRRWARGRRPTRDRAGR